MTFGPFHGNYAQHIANQSKPMSKEIKLRAWDKSIGGFVFPDLFSSQMPGNWRHWYEVQQSTGLLDKNGIEIFDGDIIEADGWNPSRYVIEFIEGGFCGTNPIVGMPIDINHWYDSTGCAIEVIGNKYEHPELVPINQKPI